MLVNNLHMALVNLLFLQVFTPGSLAELVVKEENFADLRLDQLQTHAELVQDMTVALQCRRQVKMCELIPKFCGCDNLSLSFWKLEILGLPLLGGGR